MKKPVTSMFTIHLFIGFIVGAIDRTVRWDEWTFRNGKLAQMKFELDWKSFNNIETYALSATLYWE